MIDQIPSLTVIAFAAAAVAALGAVGATSQPDRRGWRVISPGPLHWTGLWLSAALTGFMAYIFLFVGSSRPDAAFQMKVLFWLIVVFGLGAVVSAVSVRLVRQSAIRWRGATVAFAGPDGEIKRPIADIVSLRSALFGRMSVEFRDGTILRLDPHAAGAAELIDAIAGHLEQPGDGSSDAE